MRFIVLSSRDSFPRSIHPRIPDVVEGWIPVTSTGMTSTIYLP